MSLVHRRGRTELHANLTPMIDVTFLLIVFFVLVSQIVEVEHEDLMLPELVEPAAELPGDEQRAVINVLPGENGAALGYRLGAHTFPAGPEGARRLADHLATLLQRNPALRVNLRADQHTQYEWVHPALRAVTQAAEQVVDADVAPRVNLVIVRDEP
jgi:biopolymer transport protein ExbD